MIKFSASMMCADFSCLRDEVGKLSQAGVDSFHIDIMDGEFVDNFGMGYQDMECIRALTKKEMDVHLMVCKPSFYLPVLYEIGVNAIYIHPESERDPATVIEKIQQHKIKAGIAINPGTSVASISELLNTVGRVLVLGVNPGHKGRTYQEYVDSKILELLKLKSRYNFEIWLDGAVTELRIKRWSSEGVDGFILGTSCLFKGCNSDYKNTFVRLKTL